MGNSIGKKECCQSRTVPHRFSAAVASGASATCLHQQWAHASQTRSFEFWTRPRMCDGGKEISSYLTKWLQLMKTYGGGRSAIFAREWHVNTKWARRVLREPSGLEGLCVLPPFWAPSYTEHCNYGWLFWLIHSLGCKSLFSIVSFTASLYMPCSTFGLKVCDLVDSSLCRLLTY